MTILLLFFPCLLSHILLPIVLLGSASGVLLVPANIPLMILQNSLFNLSHLHFTYSFAYASTTNIFGWHMQRIPVMQNADV